MLDHLDKLRNWFQVSTEGGGTVTQPLPRILDQDPVDAFPHSAAGAAVLRRLEQRRRRLNKNRTASCSRYNDVLYWARK